MTQSIVGTKWAPPARFLWVDTRAEMCFNTHAQHRRGSFLHVVTDTHTYPPTPPPTPTHTHTQWRFQWKGNWGFLRFLWTKRCELRRLSSLGILLGWLEKQLNGWPELVVTHRQTEIRKSWRDRAKEFKQQERDENVERMQEKILKW